MNEHEVHVLRMKQLEAVLPELLHPGAPGQSCLYVGATPWRFQLGAELAEAGYATMLLEVDSDNAYFYGGHPLLPGGVLHGDVRTLEDTRRWDVIVWWHGPEHIAQADLPATLAKLESAARRLVVLAAPWGENLQPVVEGNAHQEHKAHLQPADFARLGYETATLGDEHDLSTWPQILAWKRIPHEVIVYTAVIGDYDNLKPVYESGRFVCFSDAPLDVAGWQNAVLPRQFVSAQREARRYKLLAHQWLPDAAQSLWLDGNVELLCAPAELFALLAGVDVALPRHPTSRTLADEAGFIMQLDKADSAEVNMQMAAYRRPDLPVGATGVLLRRHNPAVRRLNEMWWSELTARTARDQLSLPYCLHKSDVKTRYIDLDIYANELFVIQEHRGQP